MLTKLSKNRSALAKTEGESRDLVSPMRAWLSALCTEPDLHARFLNTLSLMEHIGSRKIMATQKEPQHDTLKHLAEEARHAFFFKRAAEKVAGRAVDYRSEGVLAGESARQYMGRLDAHIAQELPEDAPSAAAYLYMSLVIELRAIWFYRLYQDVLTEQGIALSLKSVLAEEELHLDEMLETLATLDPQSEQRTAEFSTYEGGRFRILWDALVAQSQAPAIAAS